MANMRNAKKALKEILMRDDWLAHLDEIAAGGLANVGALFSFLLLPAQMAHRAARALGGAVASIYEKDPEAARNIVRRYMWHMNEDSGNIGWGIPFAFAETLAASPKLADAYANILLSYVYDLGFADNYCDHDGLRRQCYWGIGRLAQARPELAEKARPWLLRGLQDKDSICRGMAAWALGQLPPALNDAPALRRLLLENNHDQCEIFDGAELLKLEVGELARMALKRDA